MSILHVPDQSAAERVIRPHAEVLRDAVVGAFGDWSSTLQASPKATAGLSVYARTRFIHDRTVARLVAAQASGNHPGLRVTKVEGLWVVVLSDAILLKLKKLSVTLKSRNIQTGQTRKFDRQRPVLLEAAGATNATSGYVLDSAAAAPVKLVVVCWEGKQKVWEVDLDAPESGSGQIVEIPAAPAPPQRRTKVVKTVETSETEGAARAESE